MDTIKVLGYNVIVHDLNVVPLDSKVLVNTISPNSYGLATKDKKAEEALKQTDYLVLDGLYFGLAALLLNRKWIRRITGWDCFVHFSAKMNERNGRCFFLGSTPSTLSQIKRRFAIEYPNVITETLSPPYKEIFCEEENREVRRCINQFKPDVLFVGLTAPKQEKWAYQNINELNVHVVSTIGNVFDWYAGNSKRPGQFWQSVGLEWMIRILYRPEIFRRNIGNQMLFFRDLFLILVGVKKV